MLSEKAVAPHSSTLAWKIPWTEEPGRLQPMGVFLPRHDEDLREPLVPLQGSQVSMRVARGSVKKAEHQRIDTFEL